ncbi:MAG: PPC domain-containing DNA-binding protein [candidate division WOR-3 bacterium]
MRWVKNGDFYQLRLLTGEEIVSSLVDFVQKVRIKSGVIWGLGAAKEIVLGWYDLKHHIYHRRRFRGEYEICTLMGNIAWENSEPICHIHTVISNRRFATYGGHLFEGKVGATCEITILTGRKRLCRELVPDAGLKLLKL